MRRTPLLAAVTITAAMLLTGCSSGAPRTEVTPAVALVAVPDVTGMPGNDARDALFAAGFKVDWDAGEDTVIMAGNWTVDGQSATEAEQGATVVLTVSKPEPEPAPEPAAPQTTTGGLGPTMAQVACDYRAEQEFPFGYDPHWILGRLAEEYRADTDEWFLKVEAEVGNVYGAEQSVNIECYVTGTDDAPVVTDFLAY